MLGKEGVPWRWIYIERVEDSDGGTPEEAMMDRIVRAVLRSEDVR